jgi:hypothetical protein
MTQERSKKSGGKGADPSPPSPMAVETVPIDSISPDPANARKHGARNLETVIASFRRFGQQIPLVVDKSNVVRVGNARLEAAKQLGWDTIQIVRTDLTSSEAIAYAIADNRTAELAEWDDDVLAAQLNGLLAEDEQLLASAGFDENELDALLIKVMANADGGDDDDGSTSDDEEPKDTTSFILLLTADQEILFRKAVAEARRQANAETLSEAVVYIMEKWIDGKG